MGVAGFAASERTIKQVLKRAWPEGTELRIVVVDENKAPEDRKRNGRMELAGGQVLKVFAEIRKGNPATILMDEASEWRAHCIFIDAAGFSNADDHSTVSTELAKNAECSVEIVR